MKCNILKILNLFTPLPFHFQLNLNTNTERVNSLIVKLNDVIDVSNCLLNDVIDVSNCLLNDVIDASNCLLCHSRLSKLVLLKNLTEFN